MRAAHIREHGRSWLTGTRTSESTNHLSSSGVVDLYAMCFRDREEPCDTRNGANGKGACI